MRKTVYFQYSKFQKGHNSYKNWRKLTTLELDLWYSKTKSYAKLQLDMSKHVREKCGKLHITYILSSKGGITPSKIDAKWRHLNLICITLKQSDVQNFSSICQSMYSPDQSKVKRFRFERSTAQFSRFVIFSLTNYCQNQFDKNVRQLFFRHELLTRKAINCFRVEFSTRISFQWFEI